MQYDQRSPAMVLLLTLVTCGLYLVYWYYCFYRDLHSVLGHSPTGLPFWIDFLIAVATAGLWGIYVDFCISRQLQRIRQVHGMQLPDSTMLVLSLDAVSIFTVHLLFIVTSAIQQDEWNKMLQFLGGRPFQPMTDDSTATSAVTVSPNQLSLQKNQNDSGYGQRPY